MKYLLLDSNNDIVDSIDSITFSGAQDYFMKRKQMGDSSKFYKVWTVKTKKEHDLNEEAFRRKPSSERIEWWKEEDNYLDMDKS